MFLRRTSLGLGLVVFLGASSKCLAFVASRTTRRGSRFDLGMTACIGPIEVDKSQNVNGAGSSYTKPCEIACIS